MTAVARMRGVSDYTERIEKLAERIAWAKEFL